MKMYVLLQSWVSCLFLIIDTEGWLIQQPDVELFQTNRVVEFVYYPQKIPWISARRVCQSLGGDFAKIDSKQILTEIIRISENKYGYDIFSEEYWVGLVEIKENEYFWVTDCSNLTYTSKYLMGYDDSKLCYRLKRDHTAEKRVCTSVEGFMCQHFSGAQCNFLTGFYGEVLSVGGNMSTCPERCSEDTRCWGTVEHVPDNCVLLALPGYGVESLNLTTKTCYNVVLNTTSIVPDLTNDTATPHATCGSLVITPTSSSSTLTAVTSIGNPPCEPVSVTENVTLTVTEHITAQINITTTEQLTVTSTSTTTEHSTVTSTESVTTTSTTTTTSVSVSPTTVTSTESVTTTSVSMSTSTTTSTESFTTTSTTTTTSISVSPFTVTSTESVTTTSVSMSTFTVTSTVMQTLTQNITIEKAEEVAKEIVKNLTIDSKSTSSHLRRLTSAEDSRQSAKFVGYIGIIVVVVPLGLMLIADVRKLFLDFRYHAHIYRNK